MTSKNTQGSKRITVVFEFREGFVLPKENTTPFLKLFLNMAEMFCEMLETRQTVPMKVKDVKVE